MPYSLSVVSPEVMQIVSSIITRHLAYMRDQYNTLSPNVWVDNIRYQAAEGEVVGCRGELRSIALREMATFNVANWYAGAPWPPTEGE